MAAHNSLQQSTDSGADAADHAQQIANRQYQILELQMRIDDLGIDLGSKKILIDGMLSQTGKLAPDKQIAHLVKVGNLLQQLVTKHDENISQIQSDGTDTADQGRIPPPNPGARRPVRAFKRKRELPGDEDDTRNISQIQGSPAFSLSVVPSDVPSDARKRKRPQQRDDQPPSACRGISGWTSCHGS